MDTVWYQCLVLITQFRKGAWQEIDLNQAHHTCELKSISFWTIVLVKRKLNIFHTVIYWFWEEWNHDLFCPKNSVKSCAQINRFERSSIYSYLQRDLHSWTEKNVIIMWNRLLNTAKKKLLTRKETLWSRFKPYSYYCDQTYDASKGVTSGMVSDYHSLHHEIHPYKILLLVESFLE